MSKSLFTYQPNFCALLAFASCVCLFYKHLKYTVKVRHSCWILRFKRYVFFVSKYCLSNNGIIPRKHQSSSFSSLSLCRTKHQAPQESTLLFCCCIMRCHPATGASGRSPPYGSKQFKSRAGFMQFNLMRQAFLL